MGDDSTLEAKLSKRIWHAIKAVAVAHKKHSLIPTPTARSGVNTRLCSLDEGVSGPHPDGGEG